MVAIKRQCYVLIQVKKHLLQGRASLSHPVAVHVRPNLN